MHIGLTYDLRDDYIALGFDPEAAAEFDRKDTIDALEGALVKLGHRVERIGNVYALVPKLAAGAKYDLVFNIAEGAYGFGRESQIPALLDAYRIPHVFSDALVCAVTLHKATAKHILRDRGVPTPEFWLIEHERDLAAVDTRGVLFAKPVAEGTSKGVGADARITSRAQLESVCRRLLDRFHQPVLVERFLPGREVTVGVVGTGDKARAVGTLEVLLRDSAEPMVYTYKNKEECESYVDYRAITDEFAKRCEALALRTWRTLNCRDGGRVDLRADDHGEPSVLEVNPLPGMHPEHSDLPILSGLVGLSYLELVRAIVDSAIERIDK